MDTGGTAAISFPFGLVAEAFAIRLISVGHEHDTLDLMTAFTLRPIQVARVVSSFHDNCFGSISPRQVGRASL